MIINHKVEIDLVRQGVSPKIHVVQGDVYTRKLIISLYSDRRLWRVPEDAKVLIRYLKPDRTSGVYDTLPDGTSAISVRKNQISILVAPEALTHAGNVSLVVTLLRGEQRLSTFEVDIWVQQNCSSSLSAETDTAWIAGFLPSPADASAGQHLVVEKVDEQGHVVAVKTCDEAEVVVSSQAPANSNAKIWINPEEIDEESDSGADIDVTAQVGQTIIVKEVDENGNPTEWEAVNYQEKICGQKIMDLLPETSLEQIEEDGEILFYCHRGMELKSNETYTVNWNGVSYACVANPLGGLWLLGNTAIIDGEGNGMPFAIGVTPFEAIAIPMESVETVTLRITGPAVQHVDDRYLPILVVKPNSDTIPTTANHTSAEVHDAAASGRPVFLWVSNLPPYCCGYVEDTGNGLVATFHPMTTSTADPIYLDANGNLYQD